MLRKEKAAASDASEVTFVKGIYSQVGRSTEGDIVFLQRSVDLLDNPPKELLRTNTPSKHKAKRRLKAAATAIAVSNHLGKKASQLRGAAESGDAAAGGEPADDGGGAGAAETAGPSSRPPTLPEKRLSRTLTSAPDKRQSLRGSQGELAQAIAERIRMRRASSTGGGGSPGALGGGDWPGEEPRSPALQKRAPAGPRLQAAFSSRGMYDGAWTSKFTAANSPGALNRWDEQRPDPGWYKVQYSMVHARQPNWDFRERPKHERRTVEDAGAVGALGLPSSPSRRRRSAASAPASPKSPGSFPASPPAAFDGTFLTALDAVAAQAETAAATPGADGAPSVAAPEERPAPGVPSRAMAKVFEQMALASARPDLGRIGRVHVLMHEVSCPAEDLPEQDIKGYPKLRYPKWDFGKDQGRPPLKDPEDVSCPGQYDVCYSAVRGPPKSGVHFGCALPRSVSVTTLGYNAPEAVLHPEEKRAPGACVADRSRAKDSVRHRITHVNDFDRELDRPMGPIVKDYHDTNDPVAVESVHQFEYYYDAEKADRYTTHRRDIAPTYERMLPRGRDAVQGVRALQHDLGVRGAVGLGFAETSSQREHSVVQRECRKADAARERPDQGPVFEHYTTFQQTKVQNNFIHGHAPVRGSGPKYNPKPSPLRRAPAQPFERKAEPGFKCRAKLGGARVSRQSRTHEALLVTLPRENGESFAA